MTIFQQIIDGSLPCEKVFENEDLIAFKDIAPQAPVHVLIVPKKAIKGIHQVDEKNLYLIGEVIVAAQKIAKELGIEEGYRLVTNNGASAGQSVFHLHFHLLGGAPLSGKLA